MTIPVYDSVAAACKVGCFCCGSPLEPERARKVINESGRYWIVCGSCGEQKTFKVRPSSSARKGKQEGRS